MLKVISKLLSFILCTSHAAVVVDLFNFIVGLF